MKKLKLRKWVIGLLYFVNFLIFMFLIIINDFDLVGFIIILFLILILVINFYILYKYGGKNER